MSERVSPPRGFPKEEYQARVMRAQALMGRAGLAALLLTSEAEVRYFTGYLTRFWESPTRPWFVVVPASGDPVAVIPAIGAHLMHQSWLRDIRTFAAPAPGDAGLALLGDTLEELTPPGSRIGVPSGPETYLRLPLADWARLRERVARVLVDDANIVAVLRRVKSGAEVARITQACAIAGRAFARLPEIARAGVPLDEVFRRFQMLCLEEGADWVPYLAGAAGPGGYGDVISPATRVPLAAGDVLMLDTGLVYDGYFCDFDRNFSLGPPAPEVARAHARLIEATRAGFAAARPGARHGDLYRAMADVLGTQPEGRLGHGLGMQLTEGPSIVAWEEAPLVPGMVLTLEPCIDVAPGRMLVHEENIAITETGAIWLSHPAAAEIQILEAT
ncbi:aminopeptidase P family protein [Pseudooceanicola sediminis]|uniref:Aminopeptidase P family protein n=1 Tax=Pseudooceanicola sediminis TaxID=2211117 RepID=A0A399J424_9RHOB|nr:Xaa-Pro peptidase family protein [Pseudooceanicola sediminis]KAA2313895.1 aminopeptidase P family protein [Puniceibacterium sp. HSS470]RII38712.1 aminopeptidase P family protein [Pseudooceanicola sediminis]|tara:strand:+ start:13956 stop:15119 length:1164 start_codon:yes stop_codon:yes gene_type:complete